MILRLKNGGIIASGILRKNNPVDFKHIGTGTAVAEFGVCVRNEKQPDGSWENEWLDCKAWKDLAENISNLPPSASVFLAGKMETREWTGRDGEPKSKAECVCDFVTMSYVGFGECQEIPGTSLSTPEYEDIEDGDGELPF